MTVDRDISRIVISADQLADRVAALAEQVTADHRHLDQPLVVVTVLSGAFVFVADLIRQMPIRVKLALLSVSSYPGPTRQSQGAKLRTDLDLDCDIKGMPVLIVDDILDTGGTLRLVHKMVAEHRPQSVRTAVLLRKPEKAPTDVRVDYIGFDVPNEFVVGYGLDHDGQYRNLPHIAALKPECLGLASGTCADTEARKATRA